MSEALSPNHPNLRLAAGRLRRLLWVWAVIFAGMAVITFSVHGPGRALTALPWAAGAALLALLHQPALLAFTAIQLLVSLSAFLPGFDQLIGPEPLTALLNAGSFELIGLALVRLALVVTAWNQFLFYRLLYGTAGASGLSPQLPPIPEVIPNQTAALAFASVGLGVAGILSALAVPGSGAVFSLASGTLALGLGLGVAFSPTGRRGFALAGILLGVVSLLLAITARQVFGA